MSFLSRFRPFGSSLCRGTLLVIAASSLTACDRLKSRTNDLIQIVTQSDTRVVGADSMTRVKTATQDSINAQAVVRRAIDTLTGVRRDIVASTGAAAALMPPRTRAEALGDSIANAQVNRIVGQTQAAGTGDTVRGVIKMDGAGAGSRPIMMANNGKTAITLTGMGTDGLSQVIGSDVVVRGMRIGPRDIVVSGFSVRAVNGAATIDGRLVKSAAGWVVELTDKSGVRRLPAVPEALQAFEGARVWVVEEVGNAMPQLYGVITRR